MLFIHIGMHKAGSSSIQAFLSENAERLAADGVLYPATGRPALAHHDLAHGLKAGEASHDWAEIVRLAEADTVVLSSEAFCTVDPARLAAALGEVRPRILCWQRNAAEGIVSRYAQLTKRGRNLEPFDAFFARRAEGDHLLIAPLLARWAEAFGPEAIRVRSLDEEVLAQGELVGDLLDALGAADSPGYVRPGRQNISPGWRALEIIRSLNLDLLKGEPDERALRFVRKAMPRAVARAEAELGLYERGAYLDAAQAGRMVERYNQDIAALEASGLDARLKPLSLDQVAVSETPLTEAAIPAEQASRLLRAAIVELGAEDFRSWR